MEPTEKLEVCASCAGQGWTAEHGNYHNPETGECEECPVQVQCDDCESSGIVPTEKVDIREEAKKEFLENLYTEQYDTWRLVDSLITSVEQDFARRVSEELEQMRTEAGNGDKWIVSVLGIRKRLAQAITKLLP